MATFEELQAKTKPRREEVHVLLDASLLSEHAALERRLEAQALEDAGLAGPPKSAEIAAELAELEAKIEAASDVFVLEGIGTTAVYDLMSKHPPSDEQRKQRFSEDWRTFRPALLAASCVDPTLTVDQAKWLMDNLPTSQWERLWLAVNVVNGGGSDNPKSQLGSIVRRLSEQSSGTPDNTGSLAAPSSDASDGQSPSTSTMLKAV